MSKCLNNDPNCLECKLQRHIAQTSSVPENVLKVFEEAIEAAEAAEVNEAVDILRPGKSLLWNSGSSRFLN